MLWDAQATAAHPTGLPRGTGPAMLGHSPIMPTATPAIAGPAVYRRQPQPLRVGHISTPRPRASLLLPPAPKAPESHSLFRHPQFSPGVW